MDPASEKRPTFLWRGILILLPVILLAGLGLYSLRQDRQRAETDARLKCLETARNDAALISDRLLTRMMRINEARGLDALMEIDGAGDAVSMNGSKERGAFAEIPITHTWTESDLSPAQIEAWHAARQTEFSGDDAPAEIKAWRKFIALSPPKPFLTQARYDLALALEADHQTAAADELLKETGEDQSAVTEGGSPIGLLAKMQRAKLNPQTLNSALSYIVFHPAFVTPVLLAQLREPGSLAETSWRTWSDRWRDDEETRDFYLHVRPAIMADPARLAFWAMWDGNPWLVLLVPSKGPQNWLMRFDDQTVTRTLRELLTNAPAQSDYAQLGVEISGREILPVDPQMPVYGSASVPLSLDGTNCVTVREYLARPTVLYSQQRTRTVWLAALILASAAAALAGFVSAYCGFHQQLRLSEMKSNFVSSVSHELRAPIASMRLLAESLERGKVIDIVKQKEYYGFLVQESRRLSSLIENILDFSRIEQGRKKYQLELTNLETLVEQTVRLMEPSALDHGVKLSVQKGEAAPVLCDGLAMRQALINLIDNAVKHSPKGAEVRVGLESDSREWRLWVEDSGQGIPEEEHARIFERFYRRGSELRRETQGIGIGLSIVKHTIEAHGGRIEVRSAVGQGSRFTIVLPHQT